MSTVLDYIERVQGFVASFARVEIERYEERVLSRERGNIRIRLRFSDNTLLEISEALQSAGGSLVWLSYRYHYQEPDGSVIFRYDSTPHHPEVSTHPEHKHLKKSVIAASRPDIDKVLKR